MLIAVDFDGTIVEHRYPEIGKELPFAISTLKRLQEERHRLVLWTVREGKLLDEAVESCRQRGLPTSRRKRQNQVLPLAASSRPIFSSTTGMWAHFPIGA